MTVSYGINDVLRRNFEKFDSAVLELETCTAIVRVCSEADLLPDYQRTLTHVVEMLEQIGEVIATYRDKESYRLKYDVGLKFNAGGDGDEDDADE